MLYVENKKSFIQFPAFVFQNTQFNINAYGLQFFNSSTTHFFKWIMATDNKFWNFISDNQVNAGWSFSEMCTRFKRNIHCCLRNQMLVFFFYRCDAIWLGMCFTIFFMIAFTNNSIFIYQYGSHHWIRCDISCSEVSQ